MLNGLFWIDLAQDSQQTQALINTAIDLRVAQESCRLT
jgi:hypothetical protein